ncbi:MAG TPA: carboxypeptidase regulatory-like domain-containing protein, partial [Thermoplasmatales archaeon]|nr:carboxypeptidase regulatory-like domain-containing protein [Thermoplasmatales archaeon]
MGCKKKVLIWSSILKEKLLAAFIVGMLVASYAGVIPYISFVDTAKAESPPVTSYLKGFVTDPQGLSLQGVNITFFNESENWMNSTLTDEYGYYEIGVFEGYFNFSAEKQGYDTINYSKVKINASEIIWGNLTLNHTGPPGTGTGTVCGYVKNNNTGEGIANATVCVNKTDGEAFFSCVTTNETGFYIFGNNISSGNYSVSAFKENIFHVEANYTFYPETNWLHILVDVNISSGDENCSVYGFVNYTNGSMAVGAIVWLNQTDGPFNGSDITNSSGGYCFENIPPGNYTLEASLDNFHSQFKNISILPGDHRIENLTLFEGGGPPGPGNGTVCGYVRLEVNGSYQPVPGATVCVNRTVGEPFFACGLTNDSGFYVFDGNVSAGIYDVTAFKDGVLEWTFNNISVGVNGTVWLDFNISSGGGPPEPPSPPGGNASNVTVRGVVKDHVTRNPLPNVVILLTQGGGPFGGGMGEPDSFAIENTTNSAGEYILGLADAPCGSYTIQASLDGYVTYMNWSLTIDNPGVYWVNITLTPFFTQPT